MPVTVRSNKDLKKSSMTSSNCEEMLQQAYSAVPLEITKRILQQKYSVPSRASYPDEQVICTNTVILFYHSIQLCMENIQISSATPFHSVNIVQIHEWTTRFYRRGFCSPSLWVEEERMNQRQSAVLIIYQCPYADTA